MRSRFFLSVAIYNLGDRKTDDIAGKRVVPASLGASRNRFDATYATSIGVRYVVERCRCQLSLQPGQTTGESCSQNLRRTILLCVGVCVCVF